jgi:hypothetical protein
VSIEIDQTPLLVRKFAWDLFPREWMGNVWSLLDLVPEGPDGQDMEHEDSKRRIEQVDSISSQIEVYSAIVAYIMSQAHLSVEEDPVTPEYALKIMENYQELVSCGSLVIIARLIDDGLLSVNE